MGIEYIFLFICVGFLVLLTAGLTFNTCISGSKYFKTFQLLMSSMPYSKEADETIRLILDKMDAELLVAKLSPSDESIIFCDATEPEKTVSVLNPDRYSSYDNRYIRVLASEAEIWIGSKYHNYGYIHRYNGERKTEFFKKRPRISTVKRIIALEEKLRSTPKSNTPPKTNSSNGTVELI